MTTLEVENLAAGYHDDLLVIRDFSMTAKPGTIAAVVVEAIVDPSSAITSIRPPSPIATRSLPAASGPAPSGDRISSAPPEPGSTR